MTDWAIPHTSKIKYSQVFNSNDSQRTGLLTGVQARNILIKSGLSQQILAQIWFLSDVDKDGMLTCEEFILSMHLIDCVKKGLPLPSVLPNELLPSTIKRNASVVSPTLSINSLKDVKPGLPHQTSIPQPNTLSKAAEISQSPVANLVEWNIPQQSKLKYGQLFNQVDKDRTGYLTGVQARNILIKSGLSNQHLANIWNLSDIDKDGNLTSEEFILSMHLIDLVKAGETLPLTLPLELIPLSFRRKQSINGTLVTSASNASVQSTNAALVSQASIESMSNKNTFEDKRKENFEKGQAELEKRRQLLLEQQKREQEERERKEKEEFEKKERIRLEQERKKKEELERQLQKQKELEMQKEEERKKQQELKEAARREMERQRLIEWENQKKSEMLTTKQRVQEALINLKAKKQRMVVDVGQVNSQLNGLKEKVEETRQKVSSAKQEIDNMRVNRDAKLKEMNLLKNQIKTLQERHLIIEQEKLSLSAQLKNINVTHNNSITDSADFALKSKQIRIDQLKDQLNENEKLKDEKQKDMETHENELETFKTKYEEIIERTNELQRVYDEKRKEALEVIEKSIKQAEEASKYASNLNAGWGDDGANSNSFSSNVNDDSIKYRAIYQFDGTNLDDLSLKVGDIVNSIPDSTAESGWLQGELNGKIGWFPESYVEIYKPDSSLPETSLLDSSKVEKTDINTGLNTDTYVQVLYNWEGTDDSHLSIKKDDKIKVLDKNQDWVFGECNGKTGWVPKTYIYSAEDPQYYISSYAYESQEEGDLAFDVNEMIFVSKKEDQWWTGEITENRKGVFPSTFVREATFEEIIAANKCPSSSNLANSEIEIQAKKLLKETSSVSSTQNTPLKSTDTLKSKKSKSKKPEIVSVIANYKANGKEQLDLEKGQLIQVRKKLDSGWWEGEIQVKGKKRQIGWFPAAYVKPLGGSTGNQPDTPSKTKKEIKKEVEKVISSYPYTASQDDELTFDANEVIIILSKDDATWWKGESETTGKQGLFPSNYVQPYKSYLFHHLFDEDNDDDEETNLDDCYLEDNYYEEQNFIDDDNSSFYTDDEDDDEDEFDVYNDESNEENNKDNSGSSHKSNSKTKFNSLINFSNNNLDETELNLNYYNKNEKDDFFKNDKVLNKSFNLNEFDFNEILNEKNSFLSFDKSKKNFFDLGPLDELLSCPNVFNDNSLNTDNEKFKEINNIHRNQNINEFISTEQDYINDIKIVIEVYRDVICNPIYLDKKLSDLIFLNWENVLQFNQLFLDSLLKRKLEFSNNIEKIGDIFLEFFNETMCNIYTNFCSNQLRSMRTFDEQMQTNEEFKNRILFCNEVYKEKLKLQDFTSYTLKPMQRITRYCLLIKEILKKTPVGHIDYEDCSNALKEAEKLCSIVNENCHLKEDEERLNWIQNHVKCYGIDQIINFNSLTKFCGRRKLIFYGRIVNDNNNKPLLGLLFNDFFLLVKNIDKRKRIKKYPNLFICREALESKYKIYKKPFMLDDIELITNNKQLSSCFLHTPNPNLLFLLNKYGEMKPNLKYFVIRLVSIKKFFFLRAYSSNDRKLWLNNLRKTIKNYLADKKKYNEKNIRLIQNFDCNQKINELSLLIIRFNNFKTKNYILNAFCKISSGNQNTNQDDHDFVFQSKVARFKLNSNGLFDAVFNFSSKFLLSKKMIENDYLVITCIEESPFAPNCIIGHLEININKIINEFKNTNEDSIYKTVYFKDVNENQKNFQKPKCTLQFKLKKC